MMLACMSLVSTSWLLINRHKCSYARTLVKTNVHPCTLLQNPSPPQGAMSSKTTSAITRFQSSVSSDALISHDGMMMFGQHLPRLAKYFILSPSCSSTFSLANQFVHIIPHYVFETRTKDSKSYNFVPGYIIRKYVG